MLWKKAAISVCHLYPKWGSKQFGIEDWQSAIQSLEPSMLKSLNYIIPLHTIFVCWLVRIEKSMAPWINEIREELRLSRKAGKCKISWARGPMILSKLRSWSIMWWVWWVIGEVRWRVRSKIKGDDRKLMVESKHSMLAPWQTKEVWEVWIPYTWVQV